jgi:adenosine deaminase
MSLISCDLPLIDLHRHLDGSVRLETILDLGLQHGIALPAYDVEALRPFIQVTEPQPGLLAFFARFAWMRSVLVDYAACYRVAYENVVDAQREGIDYVELRFSPWFMAEMHHLDPAGVVEAVAAGVHDASRALGQPAKLIGIISRHYGVEVAWRELAALLSQRDQLAALDLAGDEARFPGELFAEHFRRARAAGWQITIHAGEAVGPSSIWQAIHGLGAQRIGHAVRAVDDPALMDYMVEHRIGVEANLTSNVQTSTVPSYADHPLRRMLAHGILATINTDDPGISAIDLAHEYDVAAPQAGLSSAQVRAAQRNALEIAFLSHAEKQVLAQRRPLQHEAPL